jgi:hypothetical protein
MTHPSWICGNLFLLLPLFEGIKELSHQHRKDAKMKRIYRLGIGMLLLSFLLVATFALPSHSASAKTTVAAGACYDHAFAAQKDGELYYLKPGLFYVYLNELPATLKTTPYCQDINLKFTSLSGPIKVQVCFTRHNYCNDWKTYDKTDQWYTPATDVKDYTEYRFGFVVDKDTSFAALIAD